MPIPGQFSLSSYRAIAAASADAFDPEDFVRLNTAWDADQILPQAFAVFEGPPRMRHLPNKAVWINRGANILTVAHVDSRNPPTSQATLADHDGRTWLTSPVIDNRLGVYLALDLLPKMGILTDVLLTTDEESGHSTAKLLRTRKRYNWIVAFDRGGSDVVTYQFGNPALHALLEAQGWRVGEGSGSCLCHLSHLEAQGFNLGIGMRDYHLPTARCDLSALCEQLDRFGSFYQNHSRTWFPFEPANPDFRRTAIPPGGVAFEAILHQLTLCRRFGIQNHEAALRKAGSMILRTSPSLWDEFAEELAGQEWFDPEFRYR